PTSEQQFIHYDEFKPEDIMVPSDKKPSTSEERAMLAEIENIFARRAFSDAAEIKLTPAPKKLSAAMKVKHRKLLELARKVYA
ncbi:MAG: hypothetical protein ABW032_06705, partial [Burkholderiaceae bacterium]